MVSKVHPVAMRRALFCIDCSFCKLVADTTGDQIVLAYSTMGRTIALNNARIVSIGFPQLVEVSGLRILTVESAFPLVIVYQN